MRSLTETELKFLAELQECPFCCGKTFRFGPRGGASTNVFCANGECEAGFSIVVDIATFFGQLIQVPHTGD